MATLRSYHYDFPRLVKESGYDFQLCRGRVNWFDIENLNIRDITDNRNFKLLEQNLINVINCNLEREYDLKILDKNLVKLFKVAQLGVDYLSYSNFYLHTCVISLQEQLIALRKECQSLRQQKLKKNREKMVNKMKESQKYQCKKCEKIFISEIYLKCHCKRRHADSEKSQNIGNSIKNAIYNCPLTELKDKKLSVGTQTFSFTRKVIERENNEEEIEMKARNYSEIKNLEMEIVDLKNRLKKAEKALKNGGVNLNSTFPFNFSHPISYSSILPLVPLSGSFSLVTNHCPNGHFSQTSVPENHQFFSTDFLKEILRLNAPYNSGLATNSMGDFQSELAKFKEETQREKEKEDMQRIELSENSAKMGDFLIENQENINQNLKAENISSHTLAPVPFPRKLKCLQKTDSNNENKTSAEFSKIMEITPPTEGKDLNCKSISYGSLLQKERKQENFCLTDDARRNLIKSKNNSLGDLKFEEKTTSRCKTGSLFQRILTSSSPSLLEFRKNLKKSFTSLYDSVSLSAAEPARSNKNTLQTNKIEFLDDHLNIKSCSVSKEMKKQKIKEIIYETKGKEKVAASNKTQSSLIKKFSQAYLKFGGKTSVFGNSNTQIEKQASSEDSGNQNTKRSISKFNESPMYDIETDSESEMSELKSQKSSNENQDSLIYRNKLKRILEDTSMSEAEKSQKIEKTKIDFSIFQVTENKNSQCLWNEKQHNDSDESIAKSNPENDSVVNFTFDQLSHKSDDTDVGSHTSGTNSRRRVVFNKKDI